MRGWCARTAGSKATAKARRRKDSHEEFLNRSSLWLSLRLRVFVVGLISSNEVERIGAVRQPPPHPAEHFLALLLLAVGVVVLVARLLARVVVLSVLVLRRLLHLKPLDADALRFQHLLELAEAVAEQLRRV